MQAVIIAAGESSRFWPLNQKHKSLIKIMGQPLIGHLVQDLKKSGIKDIIIVQSPQKDVEKELKDKSLKYAVQKKPTGTGDALLCAAPLIKDDYFFLINANDAAAEEISGLMLARIKNQKKGLLMLVSKTKTPWLFGIVKARNSKVLKIIEKPKKGEELSDLKSDNFFLMPKDFLNYLKKAPSHPFSLIHALNLYAQEQTIETIVCSEPTLSLKYPWNALPILRKRLAAVRGFRRKTAIIGKNVVISGQVFIGSGTKIGDNTVIHGPCYIGQGCQIGDNNIFRGPVNLEDKVKTAASMEIKNSLVGFDTHFHSGYLGDSLVGAGCRVGAGFVSANRRFDRQNIFSTVGKNKIDTNLASFGVVVGNNTKIGIGVGIMPGTFIGSNSIIGPGTIVFENIPDNTIFSQEFKNIIKKKK